MQHGNSGNPYGARVRAVRGEARATGDETFDLWKTALGGGRRADCDGGGNGEGGVVTADMRLVMVAPFSLRRVLRV